MLQETWMKSGIRMPFSLLHVALPAVHSLCVYAFIHEPPGSRADCSLNSVPWVLDVFRVEYIINFQVIILWTQEPEEFLEEGWQVDF